MKEHIPELIVAAAANDYERVKRLLDEGADPRVEYKGMTPLMYAYKNTHVYHVFQGAYLSYMRKVVQYVCDALIEKINERANLWSHPRSNYLSGGELMYAVVGATASQSEQCISLAVEDYAINDNNRNSLLLRALKARNADAAIFMLDNNYASKQLDIANYDGITPIMAVRSDINFFRSILSKRNFEDIDKVFYNGFNSIFTYQIVRLDSERKLFYIKDYLDKLERIEEKLIKNGVEPCDPAVEVVFSLGEEILAKEKIGDDDLIATVKAMDLDRAYFLINEFFHNINTIDPETNHSLLMIAASNNDINMVSMLLEFGADLLLKNDYHKDAEIVARESGHEKMAAALRNTASLDIKQKHICITMLWAIASRDLEIFANTLEWYVSDEDVKTIFTLASKNDIKELFLAGRETVPFDIFSKLFCNFQECLLNFSDDILLDLLKKSMPLREVKLTKALLDVSPHLIAMLSPGEHEELLKIAVDRSNLELLTKIDFKKIDVNEFKIGNIPLIVFAARRGCPDICEYLLSKGAKPDATVRQDGQLISAIDIVKSKENNELIAVFNTVADVAPEKLVQVDDGREDLFTLDMMGVLDGDLPEEPSHVVRYMDRQPRYQRNK